MDTNYEIERKFLVLGADFDEATDLSLSVIKSVYLDPEALDLSNFPDLDISNPDGQHQEIRVSNITRGDEVTFWLTSKIGDHSLTRVESAAEITEEFFDVIKEKYGKLELTKTRFTFRYLRKFFELDVIDGGEVLILEVELDSEKQLFAIPPFVEIIREVTGDSDYYSHSLAHPILKGM